MKIRQLIFLLLPLLGLFSCAEDAPAPQVLKTSEHNLHFSGNGGVWLLTVNSNTLWGVDGDNEWCTVDKREGYNTDNLIITVSSNDTKQARSNNLQIQSERDNINILIQQDTLSGEYHYELPVIFHIIHSDETDTTQYVKDEVINELITRCNQFYQNNINSVDMNLELVPATEDPEGVELSTPGIRHILRSNSAYQNSENFLKETNTGDGELMWDPNKYVNVFVFTFTEKNVLGRTTLPHTPRQNSLPGLHASNMFYTKIPNFPWGLTLNNSYIYEENAYKTLAHELGHYLGVLHVFATNNCETETDYCEDTPNYNRSEYEKWINANPELTEQEKYQRTSCDGATFTSTNIMDYDYSHMDRFTAHQFLRIRHVLEHSPLIPGPKNVIVTKSVVEEDGIPVVHTLE